MREWGGEDDGGRADHLLPAELRAVRERPGRGGAPPEEGCVEGAGDEGPERDAPLRVDGDDGEELGADGAQLGGHRDVTVIVGAGWAVAADGGPEGRDEGADVPIAEGVV